MYGKELFFEFTVRVLCERVKICVCASFPLCYEDAMWIVIVLFLTIAFIFVLFHEISYFQALMQSKKLSKMNKSSGTIRMNLYDHRSGYGLANVSSFTN